MRRRSRFSLTRKNVLIGLLILSAVFLLLPQAWTGRLMSLVQVLAPLQVASTSAGDAVAGAWSGPEATGGTAAADALRRENAALKHRLAAITTHAHMLQRENDLLAATRLRTVDDGAGLGAKGQLVPARVISQDMVAWRSSRWIDQGTLRGVRRGAAVTSRAFGLDLGPHPGATEGAAVLLGETLVGVVEIDATHTARVKLLSDITTQRRVRIGRFTDDGFQLADSVYWLTGAGHGRMQIRDVDRRHTQDGTIQVNSTVLSDPTDPTLPVAMTIGKVIEIHPDRKNPLLRVLTVQAAVDEASLRRVYVYVPEADPVAAPGG